MASTEIASKPQAFDLDAALRDVRARGGPVLVLTHDNPDPDSLAAAEALRRLLAAETGLEVTVAMGGIIGRAENRALVRALALDVQRIEELDIATFRQIALVDTQPRTGNNSLPDDRAPDIVIDHHPARPESLSVSWCDIQPDRGASSTIVYGYLRRRRIALDTRLATALLYAIKTETKDLGREASTEELTAYTDLVRRADHGVLAQIATPKVRAERFAALDRALHRAVLYGDLCVANLGLLDYPDLVAEIADLLLPLDAAHWVMCVGRHDRAVFLSIRTDIPDAHCNALVRKVVGTEGAAGGHGMTAGGKLHAEVDSDLSLGEWYERLVERLVNALGVAPQTPTPLLPHS